MEIDIRAASRGAGHSALYLLDLCLEFLSKDKTHTLSDQITPDGGLTFEELITTLATAQREIKDLHQETGDLQHLLDTLEA